MATNMLQQMSTVRGSVAARRNCLRSTQWPAHLRASPRQVLRPCATSAPYTSAPTAAGGGGNGAQSLVASTGSTLQQPQAPATEISTPAEVYAKVAGMGEVKANMPFSKCAAMAVVAGGYISFGALLLCCVGAACGNLGQANVGLQKLVMGAFGLQYGLIMVLICGAELFTGNTMMMTAALYEKKATFGQLLRNWVVSYSGNLVGCLAMAYVINYAGIFGVGANAVAPVVNIAVAKTSLPFGVAFVRAILANWLVCIAIWMATAASSVPGKILGAYFPIMTFVAIGLEHSVANMFFIPMGILLGAPVSWGAFFVNNLLPVTLGNIIGGAVMMATSYGFIFGSLNPANKAA